MKRDLFEYTITFLIFTFSLLFIFLIWMMPERDDEWILGVLCLQTLGLVTTIITGIFARKK